jgi:translation initiation factor 2 beta subunit (eIF-2beta)/eIF-5
LEERNGEVESQNNSLIQQNLELQQVEHELRDNLLTFVSRNELQDVQDRLLKSEQERVCASITCLSEHVPKTEVIHFGHFV